MAQETPEQTPDQTIAALNEKLAALQSASDEQITALSGQLSALQTQHDDAVSDANKQITALNGQLTDLQAKHDELESTSATEISALSTQLANATKAAALGYVAVTVGSDEYKIIGKKFQIAGKIVTSVDLAKDAELLQKLVDMGSGILVKISA